MASRTPVPTSPCSASLIVPSPPATITSAKTFTRAAAASAWHRWGPRCPDVEMDAAVFISAESFHRFPPVLRSTLSRFGVRDQQGSSHRRRWISRSLFTMSCAAFGRASRREFACILANREASSSMRSTL